jgi:hypothetical protein
MASMPNSRPARADVARFLPAATELLVPTPTFTPFTPAAARHGAARGKGLCVYFDADALELLQGWSGGRQRSARVAAIIARYGAVASAPPELSEGELAVVRRLVPPLAPLSAISTLWARVADLGRDGHLRPAAQAEDLARRLRGLTLGEAVGLLEAVDQAALTDGNQGDRS